MRSARYLESGESSKTNQLRVISGGATVPPDDEPAEAPPRVRALGTELDVSKMFETLFNQPVRPRQLGRYVILNTLGRGGMGTVVRAFDRSLARPVALKVLHEKYDGRQTMRLRREAQALAKLSHPNVVHVYEVGEVEGQTFIAMELVEGCTVKKWMWDEVRPTWKACVEVFLQLGAGLAAAHRRGLVHRDFKPGNAIIDWEGRARVVDFGLVRQDCRGREPTSNPCSVENLPLEASLSCSGAVLGTPAYMPPEQILGQEADARSDQFSFCVALYEALYGERPFAGRTMMELLDEMRNGRVRPAPKGSKVPKSLRRVLLRGLAMDSWKRWPTMNDLQEELQRLAVPPPRCARVRACRDLGMFWSGVVTGNLCGGLGLFLLTIVVSVIALGAAAKKIWKKLGPIVGRGFAPIAAILTAVPMLWAVFGAEPSRMGEPEAVERSEQPREATPRPLAARSIAPRSIPRIEVEPGRPPPGRAIPETFVSAAERETWAATSAGEVKQWGEPSCDSVECLAPEDIEPVDLGEAVDDIQTNGEFTAAILDDGTVLGWGPSSTDIDEPRELEFTASVSEIALGEDFICALLVDGRVDCQGLDPDAAVEGFVEGVWETAAVELTAGLNHVCALDESGDVSCWGSNEHGQLGTAEVEESVVDVPVEGVVEQVSAGAEHTCALIETGAVTCWGRNDEGQLGHEAEGPGTVGLGEPVVQVAAGLKHSCAIGNHDTYCWGSDDLGQLGEGEDLPSGVRRVDLGGLAATDVYSGPTASTTFVSLETGHLRGWGNNDSGQAGYGGALDDEPPPWRVGALPDIVVFEDAVD